jgi:hypothetical protein
MSEQLHYFESNVRRSAVRLPFQLSEVLDGWRQLRSHMIRECPPPFNRDEWAYLISFLGTDSLASCFTQSFGHPLKSPSGPIDALYRPRGPVAVWLPNNVSLLGPLMLVLVGLTGNPQRIKASSKAEDLTTALLEFAVLRLPPGPLLDYLSSAVVLERFDREDRRNETMAAHAAVRIFFGSDAGAEAVESLPHPVESVSFSFMDHQSESWIEPSRATDATLKTLIQVFSIYGQAGCTSPRRVVVLDGTRDDCRRIRDRLLELWPEVARDQPLMHIASANIMARQLAAAMGWEADLVDHHRGVIAVGEIGTEIVPSLMTLSIVAAAPDDASRYLPPNIQTVGHALENPGDERWLRRVASSRIKRFVPLGQMHFFGPTWDGWSFWRQLFEEVVIGC